MNSRRRCRTVSIIVPVLDEHLGIKSFIDSVRRSCAEVDAEIIIADGDPEKSTISTLSPAPDLTLLAAPVGRARQMNAGALRAKGDLLLFLHADTGLPPGAGSAVLELLEQGLADAGAFDLEFDSDRPVLHFIARCARIRSRLTRIPFGDQAQFISADLFRELGGYADIPLMEDVELFRRLRRRGHPIGILSLRTVTSARRYEHGPPLLRSLKNLTLRLLYAIGVHPRKLAAAYRPHK